ncbi:MAG: DUF6065 family protein [Arenicellales bacterium]|nr:DUF6065 family protein [Arenicellales bacterium]
MLDSVVKFYNLIPESRSPQRADKSVGGTIPTRAYRFCEALRTASAFGWYVFPPIDFSLVFDGTDTIWRFNDDEPWYNLSAVQYPGFLDIFNSQCPEDLTDCAPPLIATGAEPGIVQIWSGLIAKTQKDWSLLIRSPANLPKSAKYESYEGIIETDVWFGPLFTNIRITKTDVPVDFRRERPLMQIQPLHRSTYSENVLNSFDSVESVSEFTDEDWSDYRKTITQPGKADKREKGFYAKHTRRRKAAEQ